MTATAHSSEKLSKLDYDLLADLKRNKSDMQGTLVKRPEKRLCRGAVQLMISLYDGLLEARAGKCSKLKAFSDSKGVEVYRTYT